MYEKLKEIGLIYIDGTVCYRWGEAIINLLRRAMPLTDYRSAVYQEQ